MAKKDDRIVSAVRAAAARFINRESNRRSLITVTEAALQPDGKTVRVFVSVFPPKDTRAAMDFLSRRHDSFMAFLKKDVQLHLLPRVFFLPDPAMGATEENHSTV